MSVPHESVERLAMAILAGSPVLFQRVARSVRADDFVSALARASGLPFVAGKDVYADAVPTVVDLRIDSAPVNGLDPHRARLLDRRHPLVVLLDLASSKLLLQHSPQTASICGGVAMASPSAVRPARTDDEVRLGRDILPRRLRESAQEALKHRGESVAVNLADGRLFFRLGDRLPLAQAQEELDEGIVYVGRVPDE